MLKILADKQILLLHELFASLGEVSTYAGREITPEQLEGVDVLITRSTVKVNQSLLDESSVKYVGTCTIGTDHFDKDFLDSQNITWTNAAGCNANGVIQYVLSAMAQLSPCWMQSSIGIIASGNIGGRVYRRLKALGVNCYCYDPFLSKSDNADLVTLNQVLQSDIVISHAPLTVGGAHPTFHLLGEKELNQLRPNTLLISAGRGAVIDNDALLAKLNKEKDIKVALDVWENEPSINTELIPYLDVVTPHIAGYSLEGKENGTVMVYEHLCQWLNIDPPINPARVMNKGKSEMHVPHEPLLSSQENLNQLLLAAYPIMEDDKRFRQSLFCESSPSSSIEERFDSLRKKYPTRREYTHFIFPDWAQQAPFNQWLNTLMQKV